MHDATKGLTGYSRTVREHGYLRVLVSRLEQAYQDATVYDQVQEIQSGSAWSRQAAIEEVANTHNRSASWVKGCIRRAKARRDIS